MKKMMGKLTGIACVLAIFAAGCGGGDGGTEKINAAGNSATVTTSPFTGSWKISFSGPNTGSCDDVVVASNGEIQGSCTANFAGKFYLNGTVDAQGAVSINSLVADFSSDSLLLFKKSNAATFTGRFESQSSGSGTWTDAGGASGIWSAVPR